MRIVKLSTLALVSMLFVTANVYAKGKVQMRMSKGSLKKKVDSVALVSVHGMALINGRNIKSQPLMSIKGLGKNKKEDKITEQNISETIQALVAKLNNLVANAEYYPFDFIGRKKVLSSKSYQTLIAKNLRYSQSEVSLLSKGLGNLLKKKKNKKTSQGDGASDMTKGYYTVDDYGIYVLPPKQVVQLGGTIKKEREAIFADLGAADAVLTASVKFSYYPKGMSISGGLMGKISGGGRSKGVCKADIKIGIEMANGKQVLVAHSWAETKKNWLFRNIEDKATIKGNEVANAKAMAIQAFDEAWGNLEKKLVPKLTKLQK